MEKRPATPEEAKALAHPLRLRILRLCLDEALTNKQIAEHLGKDPGSVLHHVRTLVDTGFLAVEPVRSGRKGALEKPYRATGKSWDVSVGDEPLSVVAPIDALRAEVLEAGPDAMLAGFRLAMRLSPEARDELVARLDGLGEEFAFRNDPDGEPVGMYVALHRRRT